MPQTFKDALQVTRTLGYRYLWIDALYIIQDDSEDVSHEMARMGDIYRRSTLTIFATNGTDTDSSLFSRRDARASKSCNVRTTIKRGSKCIDQYISIQPYLYEDDDTALQRRGWVLQEELLSGRLLKFGADEVHWSCVTTHAHECLPCTDTPDSSEDQEVLKKTMGYSDRNMMRLIIGRPDIFAKMPSSCWGIRADHFTYWYQTIANYSERALSVDSDRLLAISGLASLMEQTYNITYITGLWKEDLQAGLCWWVTSRNYMFRTDGPRSIDVDFPDYLAPSWSWASAHGMCVEFFSHFSDRPPEEGVQVINIEVSRLSGTPAAFGYIKFAKLSIRTRMRRIVLVPDELGYRPVFYPEGNSFSFTALDKDKKSFLGSVSLDSVQVYDEVSRRFQDSKTDTKGKPAMKDSARQAFPTHPCSSDGHEAWFVPCLVKKDHEGKRSMIGLVLTPHNAAKQEYRRIGMLRCLKDEACRMFMEASQELRVIHIL